MVSLWPFRGDDTSAAAFEKALSALATKISNASARHDRLRQRARKIRVSVTLYGGFTYILVALILVLVTGRDNWHAVEYTTLATGPFLLYGLRYISDRWYDYRISNAQDHLDSLNKERDATIEKLKAATKYNSTQQLLDKYGTGKKGPSADGQSNGSKQASSGKGKQKQAPPGDRVFIQPPPTANIPRNQPAVGQSTSVAKPNSDGPGSTSSAPPSMLPPAQGPPVTEEFAPNAFTPATRPGMPPSAGSYAAEPRWYDRILDALLGEDETQGKNRLALICQQCRLVNGQAPPGIRTPEQLGRWRCQACKAWNGVDAAPKPAVSAQLEMSPGVGSEAHEGIDEDIDNVPIRRNPKGISEQET